MNKPLNKDGYGAADSTQNRMLASINKNNDFINYRFIYADLMNFCR